jgi:putative peptidoglycan lipid II flippase
LQTVPVGIIGISYAVASFPTLVKSYVQNKALYIDHLITASRAILFWSIPFAVVFIVFRAHIVRIVLGAGAFSWNDTKLTAAALGLFAIGVISQNLVHLFVRAYYAEGNTRLPLLINTGTAIITIVGALGLRSLYEHVPAFAHGLTTLLRVPDIAGGAVLVFPIAFALGSIMNALVLFILFCGKIPQVLRLPYYRSILQSFFAAIVAGVFAYGALGALAPIANQDTFSGIFLQALIAGIVYIITWIVAQELLGNREYHGIKQMLLKKIWKTEVIVPEHEELT